MRYEDHVERVRESLGEIRSSVRDGAEKHQRTIGFHLSAAMVDMLEAFLHKNRLCYGKMQDSATVSKAISDFHKLKDILERMGVDIERE